MICLHIKTWTSRSEKTFGSVRQQVTSILLQFVLLLFLAIAARGVVLLTSKFAPWTYSAASWWEIALARVLCHGSLAAIAVRARKSKLLDLLAAYQALIATNKFPLHVIPTDQTELRRHVNVADEPPAEHVEARCPKSESSAYGNHI